MSVKGFENCIAISDNFKRGGAEGDPSQPTDDGKEDADAEAAEGKFYSLCLRVAPFKAPIYDCNFLVFTTDAEKAKELANAWVANRRKEEVEAGNLTDKEAAFASIIKTATLVNCYCVIPPDFSRAYFEQEKAEAAAKEETKE